MPYKYIVKPEASRKIWSFYRNVALKYFNTYAEGDLTRDVKHAMRSMYLIETGLLPRKPIFLCRVAIHVAALFSAPFLCCYEISFVSLHCCFGGNTKV